MLLAHRIKNSIEGSVLQLNLNTYKPDDDGET